MRPTIGGIATRAWFERDIVSEGMEFDERRRKSYGTMLGGYLSIGIRRETLDGESENTSRSKVEAPEDALHPSLRGA